MLDHSSFSLHSKRSGQGVGGGGGGGRLNLLLPVPLLSSSLFVPFLLQNINEMLQKFSQFLMVSATSGIQIPTLSSTPSSPLSVPTHRTNEEFSTFWPRKKRGEQNNNYCGKPLPLLLFFLPASQFSRARYAGTVPLS